MSNTELRKTAYAYIKDQIAKFNGLPDDTGQQSAIPLEDLLLLKQGTADPSPELVASLRQFLRGKVSEYDIDSHLVEPFQ